MRASVLVTLLVSGCFAPSPPTGAPCDTDEQCPSSQRCVAGSCGGSMASVVDATCVLVPDNCEDTGCAKQKVDCPVP